MKRWLFAVGFGAFLIGLALQTPVSRLLDWSGVSESAELNLQSASGTVLAGRIGRVTVRDLEIRNLRWNMKLLRLLVLQPTWTTEASLPSGRVSTVAGLRPTGSVVLTDTAGVVSLEELALAAGQKFIPFEGMVSMALDRAVISRNGQLRSAEGQLRLGGLVWSLLRPPAPIGDFEALLTTRDEVIEAAVTDNDASIEVDGTASLLPESAWQLDLRLRAKATATAPLRNSLSNIGRPDSDGWIAVEQTGNF